MFPREKKKICHSKWLVSFAIATPTVIANTLFLERNIGKITTCLSYN